MAIASCNFITHGGHKLVPKRWHTQHTIAQSRGEVSQIRREIAIAHIRDYNGILKLNVTFYYSQVTPASGGSSQVSRGASKKRKEEEN
jgi:hypothetical protein